MATLRLRNCTRFQLAYWRVIAFHRTNYVAAGQEGTYNWGATYTLKVKRSDENPSGENSRAAVNPGGIYYAYWQNSKVDILDERQIRGVRRNRDNPYIERWVAPPLQTFEFPVVWHLAASKQNSSNVPLHFEFVQKYGFVTRHASTYRLTVTDSSQTNVSIGAEFEIKGVEISGAAEDSTTRTREEFQETMTEEMVYGDNEHTLSFEVKPGDSLAVWQARVNIWGNPLALDHLAFRLVQEPPPKTPTFQPVTVNALVWP